MSEELIDVSQLSNQTQSLAQQIVQEQNIDKAKDLIALFNAASSKQNVVRILNLNKLLDLITSKVQERIEKRGDELTPQELLQSLQVISNSIDRANKELNQVADAPAIQLNQNNQINVNISDTLSRDSRERIMDVVKNIINKANDLNYPIVQELNAEIRDDDEKGDLNI